MCEVSDYIPLFFEARVLIVFKIKIIPFFLQPILPIVAEKSRET